MDENTRKGVIDEIIYLLTYDSGNNNLQINTESKSMNSNKKVLRLTESQLHNIIAESVSQILMELDPRTYASARDKALQRGDKRVEAFSSAADNAWTKQYGFDKTKRTNYENGNRKVEYDTFI